MYSPCLYRYIACSLFCWMAVCPLVGQQRSIDSLRALLDRHPQHDSIRGEWLFGLVKLQLDGSNAELITLANELMQIGNETQSPLMRFRAYNLLGITYARPGVNLAEALVHYDSAIHIATVQPGQEWRLREAKTLFNTAGVQMASGRHEEALASVRRSFALFQTFRDTLAMADNYRALGQAFSGLNHLDSALTAAQNAIVLYKKLSARSSLAPAYLDLSGYYRQLGQTDQALESLITCEQYLDTATAPSNELELFHHYGLLYKDMAHWSKAEQYLNRALQRAGALHLPRAQEVIHADLADLYERIHRPDSALAHFRQFQALKEERLNTERESQLDELQTRFLVEERERENNLLRTEKQLLQKQKEVTWWSFAAILLVLLGAVRYIWKIVQRGMREKTEALKAFNYSVGHDLRGPLQNARLWLDHLRNDVAHNRTADIQQDLHYVGRSMDQLQEMLEGMLRWFTADQGTPLYAPVALQSLMENIWQQLQVRAANLNTRFYAANLPELRSDKLMLRQIFENLISNAIKFSAAAPNPEIRVDARELPDAWVIEVSDNGAGFAPDQRQAIFELFKTVHLRDQYPGSGIGLALVRRLVEKLGGSVDARSEGPGQGAVFSVTLPK